MMERWSIWTSISESVRIGKRDYCTVVVLSEALGSSRLLLVPPHLLRVIRSTSARLHVLIFCLSCLFLSNMEGVGHFRLSNH